MEQKHQKKLFGGDVNPLEIPVVLQRLFELCPLTEVARARLVSKSWHDTCLSLWRRKVLIRIQPVGAGMQSTVSVVGYKRGENDDHYTNKIYGEYYHHHNNPWRYPNPSTPLNEFISHLTDESTGLAKPSPFQRFKFTLDESSPAPLRTILEFCGETITYLDVTYQELPLRDQLRALLLGSNLPKLESLLLNCDLERNLFEQHMGRRTRKGFRIVSRPTLKSLQVAVRVNTGGTHRISAHIVNDPNLALPFTWEEILNCAPNLERLALLCAAHAVGGPPVTPILVEPLDTIKRFRGDGKLSKLDSMSITTPPIRGRGPAPDQQLVFQKLRQTGLKLKSLRLRFPHRTSVESAAPALNAYQELLKSQVESLQSLNIRKVWIDNPKGILPGPTAYTALKQLTLSVEQAGKLEFLHLTPQLKSLQVLSEDGPPTGNINPKEDVDNNVGMISGLLQMFQPGGLFGREGRAAEEREFAFGGEAETEGERGWEAIWKAVREDTWTAFSGITTLKELVYDKEECHPAELECITKWFPNVEMVTIPLDDDGFKIVCRNWKSLRHLTILPHWNGALSDCGVTGVLSSSSSADGGGMPGIRELTELRVVRMVPPWTFMEPLLTTLSLSDGFFHLRHLTHLEIIANLDDKTVLEMCQRVPTCVIFRQNMSTDWDHPDMYEKVTNIWNV